MHNLIMLKTILICEGFFLYIFVMKLSFVKKNSDKEKKGELN